MWEAAGASHCYGLFILFSRDDLISAAGAAQSFQPRPLTKSFTFFNFGDILVKSFSNLQIYLCSELSIEIQYQYFDIFVFTDLVEKLFFK